MNTSTSRPAGTLGYWWLYRLCPSGKKWALKWEWYFVAEVEAQNDVIGDDLYNWQEDNIPGFRVEDYEVDGDSESIAMIPTFDGPPEYRWEFRPKEEA